MTKKIRKDAPDGATHFTVSNYGVTYYKVSCTGTVSVHIDGVGWITSAQKTRNMHSLDAAKWVELVLILSLVAITVSVLFWG